MTVGVLLSTAIPVDESQSGTRLALDCTTIDLCLSLFPWARYRAQNAAVKMHTLLDLKGNIPAFITAEVLHLAI